jgi:transcriptional regulator with XRE-family HTH domain
MTFTDTYRFVNVPPEVTLEFPVKPCTILYMHTVWTGSKPAGRRPPLCKFLAYSVHMESRRKIVGRRIKATRRAAGYKSARAFATAIGLSESSIANAERGAESVGLGAYLDIETGLGWPDGCILRYLDSGDIAELPSRTGSVPRADEWEPRDDMERKIMNSSLPRGEKRDLVRGYRDALEEERMLFPDRDRHPDGPTAQRSDDAPLKPPGRRR